MLQLLITIAAGLGGYLLARTFVRERLRFVDSIHSPFAPFLAGVLAAAAAWPLALLPVLTAVTAVAFGIGIGLGTATGARIVRRGNHPQLRP